MNQIGAAWMRPSGVVVARMALRGSSRNASRFSGLIVALLVSNMRLLEHRTGSSSYGYDERSHERRRRVIQARRVTGAARRGGF
jgi:hypothetical protein